MDAVRPDDLTRLVRSMLDAGCSGDVKAARLILEYVVPKPIRVDLATTPAPGVKILPAELLEAV